MSDPKAEQYTQPMVTPEDVKQANDRSRKFPTRPGWRAVIAAVAFFVGFAFYVTHV